jgi:hypothetical protein
MGVINRCCRNIEVTISNKFWITCDASPNPGLHAKTRKLIRGHVKRKHQQLVLSCPTNQLDLISASSIDTIRRAIMTDKLPPNLLALFAPRPPLRWVPPSDHAPAERKTAHVTGVAAFLPQLEEYKKTDVYEPTESWLQRKDRLKLEKKEKQERLLTEGPANCEDFACEFIFTSTVRILDLLGDLNYNLANEWNHSQAE